MDKFKRVISRLQPWAESKGIKLVRKNDVLRLEHASPKAGTVVSFEKGFWEKFEVSSSDAQENALRSINMDVSLRYREG